MVVAAKDLGLPSVETMLRNGNFFGAKKYYSAAEIADGLNKLRISILPGQEIDQLEESFVVHQSAENRKDHFGNNRPKPIDEVIKQRQKL